MELKNYRIDQLESFINNDCGREVPGDLKNIQS